MAPAALDVRGIIAGIDARSVELEPLIEEHAQLTAARAVLMGDRAALGQTGAPNRDELRPATSPLQSTAAIMTPARTLRACSTGERTGDVASRR